MREDSKMHYFELPLPENESQMKAAVFEADAPRIYTAWRNLTWSILAFGRDVPIKGTKLHQSLVRLHEDIKPELRPLGKQLIGCYAKVTEPTFVTLASQNETWETTHFRAAHPSHLPRIKGVQSAVVPT